MISKNRYDDTSVVFTDMGPGHLARDLCATIYAQITVSRVIERFSEIKTASEPISSLIQKTDFFSGFDTAETVVLAEWIKAQPFSMKNRHQSVTQDCPHHQLPITQYHQTFGRLSGQSISNQSSQDYRL